jgi:hypothetical protein
VQCCLVVDFRLRQWRVGQHLPLARGGDGDFVGGFDVWLVEIGKHSMRIKGLKVGVQILLRERG